MMSDERLPEKWVLCLYIAGMSAAARHALRNIKSLCDKHLGGGYTLEIVDLIEHPALAETRQIFAVPTLVRESPLPLRKIIGDLSDSERVVEGLEFRAVA